MRTFGLSELIFVVLALRWTLLLAMVAFVGGALAGLAVALMRTAPWAPLRWIASLYVQLFQGTPLLMQLFMAYYGIIVLFDITIEAWPAVAMAFTLYASAFLGEIWRGAIQAIPRQQWEAADCLALSHLAKLRYAILPQAVRIAIPPTVGFLVQLIKATSVALDHRLRRVDARRSVDDQCYLPADGDLPGRRPALFLRLLAALDAQSTP